MNETSAVQSRLASLEQLSDTTDVLYNEKAQSYGPNTKPYGTFKGLLSGEISFKAWLFPNSTKKADRQATANQIAKDLSLSYGVNEERLRKSLCTFSLAFTTPISLELVKSMKFQGQEQQSLYEPSSSSTEAGAEIKTNPSTNEAKLKDGAKKSKETFLNNPSLTKELVAAGNAASTACSFLSKLCDTTTPIRENNQEISIKTRNFFMVATLENLTITTKNPKTYRLAIDFGKFLASSEKKPADLTNLKNCAQEILSDNQKREDKIKTSGRTFKEKVESYPAYREAELKAGREPKNLQKYCKDVSSSVEIKEPLLQPPAITFLEAINQYGSVS